MVVAQYEALRGAVLGEALREAVPAAVVEA